VSWFGKLFRSEESRSGLAYPDGALIGSIGAMSSFSGQRITVEKAMRLSAVYAAVRLIAETIGMLPLKVYRDINEGGERVEARQHRCWRMLHDQPNPVQPAHRFWATAATHYLLWGNIFVEKLRGPVGLVEELWLLDPAKTEVQWDGSTRRKQFVQYSENGKRTWTDEQVLHIVGFSTDGLIGRSPIATARESLGTALAREQFEAGFYQRGAVLPGVLTHPRLLSDDAKKNLKDSFKEVLAKGEWAVLEEGLDAQTLSIPLEDMQFVESKNLSLRDIANLFNLPVSFLNGSSGDSLTYTTVESNQIQFAQITISPIVNAIAKALSADPSIFPQNVFFPEFVVDGIHRGDMKSRVNYYEKMTNIKALTPNEARALENLPPLPGGDDVKANAPPPGTQTQNGQAPDGAFSLPASQE
jgi:HK97 family phage portal protein